MTALLVLLLLGPAQTLSGKYLRHVPDYLELHPMPPVPVPAPLPGDVDALCRLIEAGHETAELFAALGDALLTRGDKQLAYRAFHRAHRLRPEDNAWGRRMQERKYESDRVPTSLVEQEEAAARFWVERLQEYERDRIARGNDPADLAEFYERYGRPEEDLRAYGRARRLSWVGGVVGVLLGIAFGVLSPRLRRRVAWLPLGVAAACSFGPALTGQTGLFFWGGGFALAGGLALVLVGKR